MRRLSGFVFFLVLLAPAHWAAAESTMDILREKIAADKKLLVAANMGLTEAEGVDFWPIYEDYQRDLVAINQRLAALVDEYATELFTYSLTDEQAGAHIREMLAIEQAELDMKKTYLPALEGALPMTKVARYLQLETKIRAVLKYELAEGVPLAE